MSKFSKPLRYLRILSHTKSKIEKAKDTFREKSYLEQYKSLQSVVIAICGGLPLLSIVTGSFYLYSVMKSMLPHWSICILFSLVLLFMLEAIKGMVMRSMFIEYYKGSKPFAMAVLALALVGGSMFTSVKGAENFYEKTERSTDYLSTFRMLQSDSVTRHYDSLITLERVALASFKKSISWKGKIDLSNKTTKAVIANHSNEIQALRDSKKAELGKIESEGQKVIDANKETVQEKLVYFLVIVCGFEIAILLCNWYLVYFQYRVSQEIDLVEGTLLKKTVQVNHEDIGSIATMAVSQVIASLNQHDTGLNPSLNDGSNVRKIGFKPSLNNDDIKDLASIEINRMHKFIDKYSHVVDCIESGLNESETLQQTSVSRSTFYNVKRCLSVLKFHDNHFNI